MGKPNPASSPLREHGPDTTGNLKLDGIGLILLSYYLRPYVGTQIFSKTPLKTSSHKEPGGASALSFLASF
jgi:hypothetical protein